MSEFFSFLALLKTLTMLAHSLETPYSALAHAPAITAVSWILESAGGMDQFEVEVNLAVAYASSSRNNIVPASLVEFIAGGGGVTAKICFVDGVCWADKMIAGDLDVQECNYGVVAMSLVRQYCSHIPIPKYLGSRRGILYHYFTEWVEGPTLHERVFATNSSCTMGTFVKIPRKVVTALAEFIYNLTTCPIPREESNSFAPEETDRV
jgi:hypothetical protein